jgi:hypothetical protein
MPWQHGPQTPRARTNMSHTHKSSLTRLSQKLSHIKALDTDARALGHGFRVVFYPLQFAQSGAGARQHALQRTDPVIALPAQGTHTYVNALDSVLLHYYH